MKIKGVHPFEQHFEKGVLALAAIGFLAVVALQFVSTPNNIEANGREIPPDQVYVEVADQANRIQSQVSDQSPDLPKVGEVDLLARFETALDTGIARRELPAPLGRGVDIASRFRFEIDTSAGDVGPIAALRVPPTSAPIAAANWATLDPFAIAEVPEYADLVPQSQPYDFASVSVEAEFSGTELRAALEGGDGSGGVPRTFWASTGMAVMTLEAQRQRRRPDGSWSDPEPITPPPGAANATTAVRASDGLVRLNETIANANDAANALRRPEFPPAISGLAWVPPSERMGDESALSEEEKLTRDLARIERSIDRLAGAQRGTATRSTGRTTRGGRTGGGRQPTRGTPSGTGGSAGDQRVELLEQKADDIRARLDELGVDTDDTDPDRVPPLLEQDSVQLWTHDLGVEPGATYRYRTRVVVNNPYFRKGPYLDDEDELQQGLIEDPFARGEWSQWSDDIRVGDSNLFFVDAVPDMAPGAQPEARIELYSMYYGYYRRKSQRVSPGEMLAYEASVKDDLILIDPAIADPGAVADYITRDDRADESPPEGVLAGRRNIRLALGTALLEIMPDPLGGGSRDGPGVALLFRRGDDTLDRRFLGPDTSGSLYERVADSASRGARAALRPPGAQPARSPAAELFEPTEP